MPGLRNGTLPDPQAVTLRRITSRQIAVTMARTALDAKADDVVILDLRRISFSFDFFVLASGSSSRRIGTVAEDIQERLSSRGVRPGHAEGLREGSWVLLDYGAVVAHIFTPEARGFYGLERLWADAPRLSIPKRKTD